MSPSARREVTKQLVDATLRQMLHPWMRTLPRAVRIAHRHRNASASPSRWSSSESEADRRIAFASAWSASESDADTDDMAMPAGTGRGLRTGQARSELQHVCQRHNWVIPRDWPHTRTGPAHEPVYTVQLFVTTCPDDAPQGALSAPRPVLYVASW